MAGGPPHSEALPELRRKVPGVYRAHETARMQELEGSELASFGRRAAAFAIDFTIAGISFTALAFPATLLAVRRGWVHENIHLHFDYHSWYSIVWSVLYFTLFGYLGNGKTPGKRLLGLRPARDDLRV
jgi:uncharacterized RDD family membrane protein YckC